MKIINKTNGAFAVLLLASSMVGAETQYPAADFQPKVVYQDPDYKHSQSSANTSSSAQEKSGATSSESDSKYPAASFQPKVLYSDSNYQHSQSTTSGSAGSQAASVEEPVIESGADKKEESSLNYIIGLVVLALVGVVLFRKSPQSDGQGARASYRASADGVTGVAKYLNRKSGTGVARYLEKQIKSATGSAGATGVAKYMAKQVDTAKTTATEAATGVEKYMRNRG